MAKPDRAQYLEQVGVQTNVELCRAGLVVKGTVLGEVLGTKT